MMIYIVTCPCLGWDCIVGVFSSKEDALELIGEDPDYIMHEREVE